MNREWFQLRGSGEVVMLQTVGQVVEPMAAWNNPASFKQHIDDELEFYNRVCLYWNEEQKIPDVFLRGFDGE